MAPAAMLRVQPHRLPVIGDLMPRQRPYCAALKRTALGFDAVRLNLRGVMPSL